MKRIQRSLTNSRAPGDVGTEFAQLKNYRRSVIVSSPGVDEVYITVGCHRVQFTATELLAVAEAATEAALAAMPPASRPGAPLSPGDR